MKVYEVKPFGFCAGVSRALDIAKKARQENPSKRIFLLGMIVHNEGVISSLEDEGFIILDEKTGDLRTLLKSIPNGEVVVFSAHGHDKNLDEIAKDKHLVIYDATCPFVEMNLSEALNEKKRPITYIGAKNHLECEAFLANCPTASFYDVKSGEYRDMSSKDPLIIAQTTLSEDEYEAAYRNIVRVHEDAKKGKQRCPATTSRQDAMKKVPNHIKTVIVLGSKTSNNSNKLYEIAKSKGHDAYLCLNLDEVQKLDLSGQNEVALSSGASTSPNEYHQVEEYLRNL